MSAFIFPKSIWDSLCFAKAVAIPCNHLNWDWFVSSSHLLKVNLHPHQWRTQESSGAWANSTPTHKLICLASLAVVNTQQFSSNPHTDSLVVWRVGDRSPGTCPGSPGPGSAPDPHRGKWLLISYFKQPWKYPAKETIPHLGKYFENLSFAHLPPPWSSLYLVVSDWLILDLVLVSLVDGT